MLDLVPCESPGQLWWWSNCRCMTSVAVVVLVSMVVKSKNGQVPSCHVMLARYRLPALDGSALAQSSETVFHVCRNAAPLRPPRPDLTHAFHVRTMATTASRLAKPMQYATGCVSQHV
jgi:hypothetical protein